VTDDLSLDFETVEAQCATRTSSAGSTNTTGSSGGSGGLSGWHGRRAHGFGASDVPALLLAFGSAGYDNPPKYLADKARTTNRTFGLPRLIAEKAGLIDPKEVGQAAARGTARERELLDQWRELLEHRQFYCDEEMLIVPETICHASDVPQEWFPLVDRECPSLTCTPDAWCRDVVGRLVGVELKCSASERRELPRWWWHQKQAQFCPTAESWGLVVCGEKWSAWHGDDGPVRSWPVQRDESAIAIIRDACVRGWKLVEENRCR